jgi:hypothetical protein
MIRSSALVCAMLSVAVLAGCDDVVTSPNVRDPNGPQVSLVRLCGISEGGGCVPDVVLLPGSSVLIEATATQGFQDLSSSCNFVWKSNKTAVRVAVNNPSRSAIVTANENGTGALTITATCNGVSGSFNITIL